MTELLAALVGAAVGAAAAWAAFAVQRRDALRPKLADAIAYMIMLRHSLDYALSRSMIGVPAEMLGHQYEGLPEGHTFSSIQAGINTAEHQLTSLYLQYPSHRTAEEIRRLVDLLDRIRLDVYFLEYEEPVTAEAKQRLDELRPVLDQLSRLCLPPLRRRRRPSL
jgi:hypothetical protein